MTEGGDIHGASQPSELVRVVDEAERVDDWADVAHVAPREDQFFETRLVAGGRVERSIDGARGMDQDGGEHAIEGVRGHDPRDPREASRGRVGAQASAGATVLCRATGPG